MTSRLLHASSITACLAPVIHAGWRHGRATGTGGGIGAARARSPRMLDRWRCPCTALLFALMACVAYPLAQEADPEYKLKAAVVSKFPQFTEWPDAALDGRATIDLCVAQPSPFGGTLRELVNGDRLLGRALVTRDVGSADELESCQVLFVTRAPEAERRALLARASMRPILTVGDYPEFLAEGGIVSLRVVDGRIRFDINVAAAMRSALRLSSQLLRLAMSVREGEP